MPRIIVRTVYGADLQTARHLGRPHQIQPYSTINEALVDSQVIPFLPTPITVGMEVTAPFVSVDDSAALKLQVFCIGNGAHVNVAGPVGGIPTTRGVPHKASDSGLYHQIPFVVRPVANDLDQSTRAKYRLRRTIVIGGALHVAYYGKVLDFSTVLTEKLLLTTTNGVTTSSPFVPTINNLRPVQPPANSVVTGTFLEVSAGTEIPFTAEEVLWLREACLALFGSEDYAIISEIALCSGVDKAVTARYPAVGPQTAAPVTAGLFEVVACQVNTFITTHHSMIYSNGGLDLGFDVGATEPLFGNNL